MKIINQTNIEINRILELLTRGYPVSNLEVRIQPPEPKKHLLNGLYSSRPQPTIKVFVRKKNTIAYKPINQNITIHDSRQYIAYIFLHEFFHYMARHKNITYRENEEEPMADQYAMNKLNEIGLTLNGKTNGSQRNNQLEQIMHHVPEQNISGVAINIIPIGQCVSRDSIGFAYRDIKKVEPNGAIMQVRNFYLKKFDCGHFCTSTKTFGLDCTNPIKGNGLFNSGRPYHIVCSRCIIPTGCHKCGIPGCKLCFTKHEGQWYCQECLRKITGGWLWALLKG